VLRNIWDVQHQTCVEKFMNKKKTQFHAGIVFPWGRGILRIWRSCCAPGSFLGLVSMCAWLGEFWQVVDVLETPCGSGF